MAVVAASLAEQAPEAVMWGFGALAFVVGAAVGYIAGRWR